MKSTLKQRLCGSLVAALLCAPSTFAQDNASGSRRQRPSPVLEIISVEHAKAADLESTLDPLFQHMAVISSDARTNSLIISTTDQVIDDIRGIISKLDVPSTYIPRASPSMSVRAFQLKHALAEPRTLSMLYSTLGSGDANANSLQLAADPRMNQIIASGQAQSLEALASLLEIVDQPAPMTPRAGEFSVRLLWLVGGDSGATRDVPADLKAVTDELARYGVSGLRLAAQSITRVSVDEDFTTTFSSNVMTGWSHEVKGRVSAGQDQSIRLEIRVLGESERRTIANDSGALTNTGGEVTKFGTTISTSSGHFVVLNMNPVGDMDSVFVLQVNEAD